MCRVRLLIPRRFDARRRHHHREPILHFHRQHGFLFFGFFFKIKYVMGVFWEKMPKVSNCHNLKVFLGGLSVTFETLEVKVKIGG
jgi:hypothetical protein